jgi:hypothetical protein
MSVAQKTNFRLFPLLLSIFCGLLPVLYCLLPQRVTAEPMDGEALSQRRINELAASLQRARLALIENTGLRRPQEPLLAYFLRIVEIGSGEADQAYQARIKGYMETLTVAEKDTASLRTLPTLRHNAPANQRQWQQAIGALHLLPARIQKIRALWQALQQKERAQQQEQANRQSPYRRLGMEFTQAMELILVAYNALRDAEP